MPLACLPVQIAGRNRLWRDLLDGCDPQGSASGCRANTAANRQARCAPRPACCSIAGSAPIQMQMALPTRDAADEFLQKYMQRELDDLDANDLLYQVNASRDYDPSAGLEKIRRAGHVDQLGR